MRTFTFEPIRFSFLPEFTFDGCSANLPFSGSATANPWFCEVILTFPVFISITG